MIDRRVFPHNGKLHLVAVTRVEVAVDNGFVHVRAENRLGVVAVGIPAEDLVVDAMLSHHLDFPVGNLRRAFVIVAENRRDFGICRDLLPTVVRTFAPQRADV